MADASRQTTAAPDLSALEDTYEIVGELRGSGTVRNLLARRRADDREIVITVVAPPEGAENNELPHYAADVQLLAGLSHPHLAQVYESRWLGSSLAVVRERVGGDTLAELLDRGERFRNPRVAAVLHEVLGVLDWARARGVVHRDVTPESLYFEEGTERVIVALTPAAIPITGVADERLDAQTIGELAWTMLAGQRHAGSERRPPLGEVAPNLAQRVVDATGSLLDIPMGGAVPDVPAILGVIAAGDVLKQAEVEMAAMKEEYEEQHRAELARCENRRIEVEQHAAEEAAALADERADLERRMAEAQTALEVERADFARLMEERQTHLAGVRAELERQAEELERRLADFDKRRTDFERVVLDRQREVAANPELPVLPEATLPDDDTEPSDFKGMFAPLDQTPQPQQPATSPRRRWAVPVGIGAAIVALSGAVAVAHYENSGRQARIVAAARTDATAPAPRMDGVGLTRGGFLSQSAGGSLAPSFGAPLARRVDSIAAQPDSANLSSGSEPVEEPAVRRPERTVERPVESRDTPAEPVARPRVAPREPANDVNGMTPSSVFTLPPRDTTARMRDTVVRPDSISLLPILPPPKALVRRDTVRRDTLARPDTALRVDTTLTRGGR